MAKYTITKSEIIADKCEALLDIEIGVDEIKTYETKSLRTLGEKADIPGFRKGHIPEAVIR